MLAFKVDDMTCGHCVSTIRKAIEAVDPGAQVQVDLPAHRVHVETAFGNVASLAAAITAAGYSAVEVTAAMAHPAKGDTKQRSGCCCG